MLLRTGKFKHIGLDMVAAVANDILCSGAAPYAFLDYFAAGKLHPKLAHYVVQGIQVGCEYNDMTLVGGETAELPNHYADEQGHDFAGFGMGVVERGKLIDGSKIREGDVLIGLRSNGVGANGFSLIQYLMDQDKLPRLPTKEEIDKIEAEMEELAQKGDKDVYDERVKEIQKTMGELQAFFDELLRPAKFYHKPIMAVLKMGVEVHGIAHITGGGLPGNLPRMLSNSDEKDTLSFDINVTKWEPDEIFQMIRAAGVPDEEMWKVFNNGIGMVLCVAEEDVDMVFEALDNVYEDGAVVIGTVITREEAEGKEVMIG